MTGIILDFPKFRSTVLMRLLFVLPLLILIQFIASAQSNWNGNADKNWANPSNWSAGVPDADDLVEIPGTPANQPEITGSATVKAIIVRNGAKLTLKETGTLTVTGQGPETTFDFGTVRVAGTLENKGLITINALEGKYGIYNSGTINNLNGEIKVDRSSECGVNNVVTGTFTNAAKLTLGAMQAVGNQGIWNYGTFNNTTGEIAIDNAAYAVVNETTFTNSAKITIGVTDKAGSYGIWNKSTFTNEEQGEIVIDNISITTQNEARYGVLNATGVFTNSGSITVQATNSASRNGIVNRAQFNHNAGEIKILAASDIALSSSGTFDNKAKITIGSATGQTVNGIELETNANFTNYANAEIIINHVDGIALRNVSSLTNSGQVLIGNTGDVDSGILNIGSITNQAGGVIEINRTGEHALQNTFQGGREGVIYNSSKIVLRSGNFSNSSANLVNYKCASVLIDNGNFTNSASGEVENTGLIQISGDLTNDANPSSFVNQGILTYSNLTNRAVSNNQLVIRNKTKPIIYYSGNLQGTIEGIYTDHEGTQSAGLFQAPDYFFPDASLSEGSHELFMKVTLFGQEECTYTVAFDYEVTNETDVVTLWLGTVSTAWENPANWTTGVPDADDDAIIRTAANQPVISAATLALVHSVLIEQNASLTINADATLTINGSASYTSPFALTAGLNNLGTVVNNGNLVLGSAGSVGAYGILNQGMFTNGAGADIHINNSDDTALFNASGQFNNDSDLTIGNAAAVGNHGIWNDGQFRNRVGGDIRIDRSSLRGIVNNSGTFEHDGEIRIGAVATVRNDGLRNRALFVTSGCSKLLVLKGSVVNESSASSIVNQGLLQVTGNVTTNNGLSNFGVLKYGSLTGTITNTYLIIENTTGTIFTYGSSFNGTVNGIFTDAEATLSGGNFTAPNTFVPTGGASGIYPLFVKVTTQGGGCSYTVPFTFTYTAPAPKIVVKGKTLDIANGDTTPRVEDGTNFWTRTLNSTTPAVGTFTLHNTGNLIMNVTGVTVTGSTDFVVKTQPATQIASGSSSNFEITFTASSLGVKTATVSIASDDPERNSYTFSISGEGIEGCEIVTTSGTITWTGSVNSDWNNACNWSPTRVPGNENDVVVVSGGNQPTIYAGGNASVNSVLVQSGATLIVAESGNLSILGSTSHTGISAALYNEGTVNASGLVFVTGSRSIADFGLYNTGTITANAMIDIAQASVEGVRNLGNLYVNRGLKVGRGAMLTGILNQGTFEIVKCAKVEVIKGNFVNGAGKTVTNSGLIVLNGELTNNGSFVNNGVLKYSALTGTVTNNNLVVNDVTSIGSTPIFSYGGSFAGNVFGIYTTENGSTSAGTFTAPNTFTPTSPLLVGVHKLYAFVFPDDNTCEYAVPFYYEVLPSSTSYTIWTGTENSNWNDDGNWTAGIPTADKDARISDGINDPIIATGLNVVVRSLLVQPGAVFTIQNGSSLTINNSFNYSESNFTTALNNLGTVINNGRLSLGAIASVGSYGIVNQGVFENKSGAQIEIDKSTNTGIFNAFGTFTNNAVISIGGNTSVSLNGIWNNATFNNSTGGIIRIDRSSEKAIVNNRDEVNYLYGIFANNATITIGASAAAGNAGIFNRASFKNNQGGDIHIDRTSNGIDLTSATFENAGTVTVGQTGAVTSLFARNYEGSFRNQTGGLFKASGEVAADAFTHAGGTLAPGYSPGRLIFNGAQDFSSSVMEMEINGTGAAGVNFDQIAVNGMATLGGKLNVSVNYTPVNNDEVTLLSALVITGTFSNESIIPANWQIVYTENTVKLVYINPLPVTLVMFNARAMENAAFLTWRTTSETNNAGFYIERSTDGKHWDEIGFVAGVSGSSQERNYEFSDKTPFSGLNYYRLRQVDLDGTFAYSRTRSVNVNERNADVIVWIDENRQGHIKTTAGIEQVTVFDLSGRGIAKSKTSTIDLTHVAQGILLVRVQTNLGTFTRKLVLF